MKTPIAGSFHSEKYILDKARKLYACFSIFILLSKYQLLPAISHKSNTKAGTPYKTYKT